MQSNYFAEWLDRTLTEQGVSGSSVARAVGVSDGVVSRWRNGKGKISLENARKLAGFFEVDALRMVVTAGLLASEEVGVEPLPIPQDTRTRQLVKDQIMNIRLLGKEDKRILIEAYDRSRKERSER